MENKIVNEGLGKVPIKLAPVAGKTPRAEHIRVSKTKTRKQTMSGRSNKGKKTLASKQSKQQQKQSEQQQQQSEQQQQQSEQQQPQNEQRQHQPTYDSDLSEDGRAEHQALMEIKRVQSERPDAE